MSDKIVKLRELPVTVNVTQIAEGIKEMFDENELVVLRFGMLPAKKMELLETSLRERFEKLGVSFASAPDRRFSTVDGETTSWSLKALVSEAMHEVTLGIYDIGELVV